MKQLLFILIYTYCFYLYSLTLEKVINLNDGWSIFFLNENNIIITEKKGLIKLCNIKNKSITLTENSDTLTKLLRSLKPRDDYLKPKLRESLLYKPISEKLYKRKLDKIILNSLCKKKEK